MTDENKNDEGQKPNSSSEENANPQTPQKPEPQVEKGASVNPEIAEKVKALEEKLDQLKGQYKGSSEEALRLKEENDKLKKEVEKLKEAGVASGDMDASFNKIMEEQGIGAAVDYVMNKKLASLEKKVSRFEEKESAKVLEDFKASHKGLDQPEVFEKFEKEFNALSKITDSLSEAMEKAYILAGGPSAENAPGEKTKNAETPQKGNTVEEEIVKNVVGAEENKRSTPPTADDKKNLQQQINDLQYEAMALQSSGRVRQAAEVLSRAEDLKARLGESV